MGIFKITTTWGIFKITTTWGKLHAVGTKVGRNFDGWSCTVMVFGADKKCNLSDGSNYCD
jgi:hypothetical protein